MSSFGRYFRGLTAFDLLGNLVPGLIVVLGALGSLGVSPLPSGIEGLAMLAVAGFSVGGLVQSHASWASGEWETFELTIKATEKPTLLDASGGNGSSGSDTGSNGSLCRTVIVKSSFVWRPFVSPAIGERSSPRGQELDDRVLTGVIRQHLVDTHEIPRRFNDFQVLYHLMLSRIERGDSSGRAVRMQALRNFYRGIWISLWWVFVFVLLSVLVTHLDYGGTPNFADLWTPVWQLLPVVGILLVLFEREYESHEEDLVEYLFTDYATAISTDSSQFDFAEETSLRLKHGLTDEQREPPDEDQSDEGRSG